MKLEEKAIDSAKQEQEGEVASADYVDSPTFAQASQFWHKLGWISFGGPAGQIALMHRELVEQKRWIGETQFFHALNFTMLLPGPEAQQLATYLGWRLHGVKGGVVAGALFVLPSVLILWGLSLLFVYGNEIPLLQRFFQGLSAAVVAVLVQALWRLQKKALTNPVMWVLAIGAFVVMYFWQISFVWVLFSAAVVGILGVRFRPKWFPLRQEQEEKVLQHRQRDSCESKKKSSAWIRAGKIAGVCLVLWWVPVLLAGVCFGWESTLFQQGIFFSKAAMLTFGGAYAVLPYVAQQAVEVHHWLDLGQMMSGLGLAETTPGPLVIVLEFVGFVGGWQNPGTLPPLLAATLGALMTVWVTFVPCFFMVFLAAPWVEKMNQNPLVSAALTAITAVVVGVILNLSVFFAQHLFFPPSRQFAWPLLLLALAAFALLRWSKFHLIVVIFLCGVVGMLVA